MRRTAVPVVLAAVAGAGNGATTETELALGTLMGKPIAYASISGAKKARLFISADCQED